MENETKLEKNETMPVDNEVKAKKHKGLFTVSIIFSSLAAPFLLISLLLFFSIKDTLSNLSGVDGAIAGVMLTIIFLSLLVISTIVEGIFSIVALSNSIALLKKDKNAKGIVMTCISGVLLLFVPLMAVLLYTAI